MLEIDGLSVTLGDFSVRDITISVREGEFFVIVGPTGVGKTVFLETILGFYRPSNGRIYLKGIDITDYPPERRNIAMVYQDYALFPHLTVRENILYGLRYKSLQFSEDHFDGLVKMLGIWKLLDRYPETLSGGEKQRVAIARALIVQPEVLLLDEPLSSLDPSFRDAMRREIRRIQKVTGKTVLMVTHDFLDVFALADRVAVMNAGVVEQVGDVGDVFRRPASRFVAEFVGMKNIFLAEKRRDGVYVNGCRFDIGRDVQRDRFFIALRPEDIIVSEERVVSSARNTFEGEVIDVIHLNPYFEVKVGVDKLVFNVVVTAGSVMEMGIKKGKKVWITFKASSLHII